MVLNADENTVETPFDDLNSLPQEVVSRGTKSVGGPCVCSSTKTWFINSSFLGDVIKETIED